LIRLGEEAVKLETEIRSFLEGVRAA